MKINGGVLKGVLFNQQIKQWQFAQVLGISESNISRLLAGKIKPTAQFVIRIATLLKVKPDLLIDKNTIESGRGKASKRKVAGFNSTGPGKTGPASRKKRAKA